MLSVVMSFSSDDGSPPAMNPIIALLLTFVFVFSARAETWSSIESEHFIVRFTESISSAQEIQDIAESFYPQVTNDLGYSVKGKITIWFCESRKEFDRSVNAPIQDWAVGCAYPLQARIVILDPAFSENRRINLSHLVKHEIAHVIFGLYVGENLKNVPRWFNEGVAMYLSDDWTYSHYWAILTGTLSNSIIPLYRLSIDFPEMTSRAQIAYAQSYSVLTFMIKRYGNDALKECIRLIAEGKEFDEALAGATGADMEWLESRWLKDLKKRYKWVSLISSWVILWSVAILIVFIAYSRRKIKNRRIIKQWKEEEKLWEDFDFSNDMQDKETDSEDWTYRQ